MVGFYSLIYHYSKMSLRKWDFYWPTRRNERLESYGFNNSHTWRIFIISCQVLGTCNSRKITRIKAPTFRNNNNVLLCRHIRIAYSHSVKTSSHKTTIPIKFVDTSIIFYYTKLHLRKCNGSWVVSMKQNMNFKFTLPSTFMLFVFSHKNGLNESSSFFECLSAYKIHSHE
jgi:hypothetical protein